MIKEKLIERVMKDAQFVREKDTYVEVKESLKNLLPKTHKIVNVYIDERDTSFKGRNVYIDLPDKGIGLRVRSVKNGRLYWRDEESGKYSAVLMSKVQKERFNMYEYVGNVVINKLLFVVTPYRCCF